MYSSISRKVSAPSVFSCSAGCSRNSTHTTIALNGGAIYFFNILLISFSAHNILFLPSFHFIRLLALSLYLWVCKSFLFFKPFSRLIHAVCNGIILMQCFLLCFLCTFSVNFFSFFSSSHLLNFCHRFFCVLLSPWTRL